MGATAWPTRRPPCRRATWTRRSMDSTGAEGEFVGGEVRRRQPADPDPGAVPADRPHARRDPDLLRRGPAAGRRRWRAHAHELDALPGGIDALAPDDGRIPVENLQGLSPAMARVRGEFEQAAVRGRGHRHHVRAPPGVIEAGDLLREKLAQALPPVRSADEMLRALPAFAGIDAPRHYLLGPENSAELRATGGCSRRSRSSRSTTARSPSSPFRDIKDIPSLDRGRPRSGPPRSSRTSTLSFNSAGLGPQRHRHPGRTHRLAVPGEPVERDEARTRSTASSSSTSRRSSYLVDATGPLEVARRPRRPDEAQRGAASSRTRPTA